MYGIIPPRLCKQFWKLTKFIPFHKFLLYFSHWIQCGNCPVLHFCRKSSLVSRIYQTHFNLLNILNRSSRFQFDLLVFFSLFVIGGQTSIRWITYCASFMCMYMLQKHYYVKNTLMEFWHASMCKSFLLYLVILGVHCFSEVLLYIGLIGAAIFQIHKLWSMS